MGPRCSVWPFLRIVYTETIVGMCAANILVNFFFNIFRRLAVTSPALLPLATPQTRKARWDMAACGDARYQPSALLDRH